MRNNLFSLRATVLAVALVATSATASAANFSAFFNFDNVASDSVADTALGSYFPLIHFGNAGTVADDPVYDSIGNLLNANAFHWVDATSSFGDVLVKDDGTAVSPSNVLWNDNQPILVMFSAPQTLASFSIQQDMSQFGFPGSSYMAFLDSTGHEIAGAQFFYTQFENPGLLIQSTGSWANVSAVLLPGGKSYDNLSVTAVPEPATLALMLTSLGLIGLMARRRP
jgi:hypothetical protein